MYLQGGEDDWLEKLDVIRGSDDIGYRFMKPCFSYYLLDYVMQGSTIVFGAQCFLNPFHEGQCF